MQSVVCMEKQCSDNNNNNNIARGIAKISKSLDINNDKKTREK